MLSFEPLEPQRLHDFYKNFRGAKTFLQHPAYGALRLSQGETVFHLGVVVNNTLLGTVLIQKVTTKLKTFLHIPHGPLIPEGCWEDFLRAYVLLGKKLECDFVRISPLLSPEKKPLFTALGFKDAAIHLVNPEKTWVLDIMPEEETLLAGMKKSTRYEVRRAGKVGFEIQKGRSTEDLEIFWNLHKETVKRNSFVPFTKASTEQELEIFGDNCQIISVLHEGVPQASGIFIFDDRAGYYHQGASLYSKLPVAHAYIWEAIKESRARGVREFNFWGVCDAENVNHPWVGLSKFKRGFGGEEQDFLHVQDFSINTSKYRLNRWVEKYRKWKRGY